MKDASTTPKGFKKYSVTSDEIKEALGIDWPGKILSVDRDYRGQHDGFTITMYTQPHELTGETRARYTQGVVVPVPADEPAPPPAPRKKRKGRWFG